VITRLSDWVASNPQLGMSCSPGCVLTDGDWKRLADKEVLVERFVGGERTDIRVQEACLEVHLAKAVKLTATGEEEVIPEGEDVVICPGDVVIIATEEHFTVPHDVQGQMSPKAKLLTIGLSAPTTQVDPGFAGQLFLAIANPGPRAVKLPGGYAVAKVEMQVLCDVVDRPWVGKNPAYSYFARELIAPADNPCDPSLARRIQTLQRWLLVLTASVLCVPVTFGVIEIIHALDLGKAGFGQDVLAGLVAIGLGAILARMLKPVRLVRTLWRGPA
jgi:deoxycytidine triphosphate deaminase